MPRDTLRDELQRSLGSSYTIERELTPGGMSRVFLAEETRFHRRVVVKVLSPELAAGISAERSLASPLPDATAHIRGSVTPTCDWYFPFLSLYDTSGCSFPSKKSTCAIPSLA